jgi:hypothetical protein
MMRGSSAAESNALWNSLKFDADRVKSGGCPGGALDGPHRYTAAVNSRAARITPIRRRFFIS